MRITSSMLLRIGLGVTFVWIGILILEDPAGWARMIKPWARRFLPGSPEEVMVGAGILDIAVGALLIANRFVWEVSIVAALHLIVVFATVGFTRATVRNIGLLIALLALFVDSMPPKLAKRIPFLETSRERMRFRRTRASTMK